MRVKKIRLFKFNETKKDGEQKCYGSEGQWSIGRSNVPPERILQYVNYAFVCIRRDDTNGIVQSLSPRGDVGIVNLNANYISMILSARIILAYEDLCLLSASIYSFIVTFVPIRDAFKFLYSF